MSGRGTGTGGATFQDSGTPCDKLELTTTLASPVPEVVADLSEADVLDLELRRAEAAGEIFLVMARYRGRDAGSIVEGIPELIRCMQEGHGFKAAVLSVDEGIVRVRVRPG